ncbi:MAG: hypothetical protein K8R77_02625 [Anaerolineaceae bacterium]|nr:hypothetical protein [Anaerolineaceae bacterium]
MFPKDPNEKPVLKVLPEAIDFGRYHPNTPLTEQPVVEIIITNTGTGTLQGRLVPAVSWLIPKPIAFSCKAGETSRHAVRISTGAPIDAHRQEYNFEEILLVSSNAGEQWFTASYQKSVRSITPGPPIRIWLFIPAALFVIAAIILFFAIRSPDNTTPSPDSNAMQAEMIFTQAAQTLFVEMTSTAALASSQDQATQASISIALPTPQNTSLFAPTATFTPWPRQEYPNPEQFILAYYQAVDQGDYEKSWGMLSGEFQETCCHVAGNDPFIVYTHFWDNVEKVEVLSAYLQDWNANPAIVFVTLAYEHSRGDSFEEFHIFYLITNPQEKGLLIDQVQ